MSQGIRYGACAALLAVVLGATAGAGEPTLTAGQESTVALSPSNGTVKVFLPSNYSADQKWPAIFFYHGMGGSPDTSFLRSFTDGRDYVLVGMSYLDNDDSPRSAQEQERYLRRELEHFRAARNWLTAHASIDETRLIMAGASKGGWTTSALGELELPRLGGLIILLAGRPESRTPKPPAGALQNKPIYIGDGEMDPNLIPARRAREFYRRNGAVVTFEEYMGKGHEVPPVAPRLSAWLEANGRCRQTAGQEAARKELAAELETRFAAAAAETNALTQYGRLLDLVEDPRTRLYSPAVLSQAKSQLVSLARSSPVKEEWTAETTFNELVYRETCIQRLADMKAVLDGYQKLAQLYPQTRYGKLSAQYAPHLADAYQKSVEATAKANANRPAGGTTNTTSSVKPAFPVSGPGRPPILIPVRKGNKITFEHP
jgi:predicted esterase